MKEQHIKDILLWEEIAANFGDGSGDGKIHADIDDIFRYVKQKLAAPPCYKG